MRSKLKETVKNRSSSTNKTHLRFVIVSDDRADVHDPYGYSVEVEELLPFCVFVTASSSILNNTSGSVVARH